MMSLTVMVLAEEVRESNRRLTQAIDNLSLKFDNLSQKFENLNQKFENLSQKFDSLRVEVAKELGAINANLEGFKARVDAEMGVAKWAVKVMTPAVFSLIVAAVGGAWYLAKVDAKLDMLVKQTSRVEVRTLPIDKSDPAPPLLTPDAPPLPGLPKAIPNVKSPNG